MPAFIDYCRYYGHKVDDEKQNVQMFVRCEKAWLDAVQNSTDNSYIMSEYINAGLTDFERYDNTPILLKAILFNRFIQYNERVDIDGFKDFYLREYIGQSAKTA